jgi:hypothetical protein
MSLYRWLNHRHQQTALRKMGLALNALDLKGPNKWDQWKARRALRDRIRESRPWWLKAYDSAHGYLFGWNGLIRVRLNPRNILNHHVWNRQRAKRGWADRDVWSMDSYISRVLGEMCAYLAEHNVAYPGEGSPWPTPEIWHDHLVDLSSRLLAWNQDDAFCDENAYNVTQKAMEEFGRNLGYYWD